MTHFVVLMAVFMLSGYIAHRHVLPMIGLAMPATALGVLCVGEFAARRIKAPPRYVVPILLVMCCGGKNTGYLMVVILTIYLSCRLGDTSFQGP